MCVTPHMAHTARTACAVILRCHSGPRAPTWPTPSWKQADQAKRASWVDALLLSLHSFCLLPSAPRRPLAVARHGFKLLPDARKEDHFLFCSKPSIVYI